ncbi:MAG: hypothetical protein EPO67_12895 [Reyranella sp.]|nr:MAG: hypothetical protein EPO67_12895 [Reyranella sp.]
MNHRILAVLALLALAPACTLLPPQPPRFNAYQGLTPGGAQPAQSPIQPPIQARGKSVALVVSDSSEKQYEYVEAVIAAMKGGGYMYSGDIDRRGRPDYFNGQIIKKFQSKFARVELVDDFRKATAGRYDYIGVIDIAIQKPASTGTTFGYDIDVDILTPNLQRIVSLKGKGLDNNRCPGSECAYATDMRALQQAMDQFYAAFDANIR